MSVEIKIPALGESITEATISHLLVQSGSQVEMDQEIVEIETEKVNQVLYAPSAGTLTLSVQEGESVKIGQVIGQVEPGSSAKKEPAQPPPQEEPKKEEQEKKPVEDKEPQKVQEKQATSLFEEVRQKPEAFVQELKAPLVQKEPTFSKKEVLDGPQEERKRMSKIRQTIARRLVDAKQTMAMLTTFNEVDMSAVMAARSKYKEDFLKKHGVKLGFMSFFVKAVAQALKHFPAVNAYIEGEDIVYRHYYDINVAISSDRGLVVPVISHCDQLSFADIEKAIVDLSKKAKENKLSMDEMRSGGFTITNGGIFGSSFSTPIVNPPQSAILGMHKIADKPCALNGQVVIRPMMVLALSYDHRIVDGKEGVSFLAHIVKLIEDPTCLLIDL